MQKHETPQLRTEGRPSIRLRAHDKIDVCRGLFAFLVVGAHGLEMTWSITPEVPDRLPWLAHRVLRIAVGNGIYWVMGFFVISGYCIYLSASAASRMALFSSRAISSRE